MSKIDLFIEPPLMNVAGTLGFSPDLKGPTDLSQFGAFVTNPISWTERTPAKGGRYLPFVGGFLLHTGYPNPGLKKVVRQHRRRWAQSPIPILVHVLAQDPETVSRMVERLESVEGVMGVEIGLPPDIDPGLADEMVQAAIGELAVIAKVPFEYGEALAFHLAETGISAVSLAPPRGLLPNQDGQLVSGRLYGPGLFPQTLALVRNLATNNIPVIGAGGIYSQADITAMQIAGACAVQLDAVLWRGVKI